MRSCRVLIAAGAWLKDWVHWKVCIISSCYPTFRWSTHKVCIWRRYARTVVLMSFNFLLLLSITWRRYARTVVLIFFFLYYYCFYPFLFFLYTFFLQSGIDKSTERSTIPACPSLMCFLQQGWYRRDSFFANLVLDVCVCFVLCRFVSGLILWFDDLRAE